MEERGRLLYEEDLRERRAQGELNANHIGIFMVFLFLVLTWTLYGYTIWKGVRTLWIGLGFILALILTGILLFIMDRFIGIEFTQNLPIKIYEKGILMPTTPMDRIIGRKRSFIHDNDLESVSLVRAHKPNKKDLLIAKTKQKKVYLKRYNRDSNVPDDILENIQISAPQAKISISE
jgi:hypothetical protein